MEIYKLFFTVFLFLFLQNSAFCLVTETFEGMDANALKAGISKYILTKGGTVDHGDSYENNTLKATEAFKAKYTSAAYFYTFNIIPLQSSAKLEMNVILVKSGIKSPLSSEDEQKIMNAIVSSIKGRFLYGLGFDFEYYDTPQGKIKAPKGHQTGIKLTAVKYDALKKGLMAGDVITEINGIKVSEIPIEEFSTALYAKSLTDSLTLTYKRGNETATVTLSPRLSNTKVF